ncbi:MAG: NBR1-Ig-like domain-containing protein [Anaerolineales bacterium]|jgi:hypothetical protein
MKSLSKFSSWAVLSVLIGYCACGCGSHATATSQAPFFTSVAETAAAQFPIYATAIPLLPSATQTLMPTSTYAFFPTLTPYATYAVEATSSACNDSAYVADVTFPDNTVLAADASFDKTWSIQNTGTCTWDANYSITFVSGDQMSGATTTIGDSVAPGDTTDITVSMVSPSSDGSYTGYWRMADDNGNQFGESVYVLIQVSSSVTSTPTITPTRSDTSVATSTVAPTSAQTTTYTPVPAATSTSVPANTSTSAPTSTPVPSNTSMPVPSSTFTAIPPTATSTP